VGPTAPELRVTAVKVFPNRVARAFQRRLGANTVTRVVELASNLVRRSQCAVIEREAEIDRKVVPPAGRKSPARIRGLAET
jgi:hypothetical protein